MEAKRRIAIEAMDRVSRNLASVQERRASIEAELYRELASTDTMSVTELDCRCHRVIERLTAKVTLARQALEQARIAQEQSTAALFGARAIWAKRTAASQKWRHIECDVQRTTIARSEFVAEIETEDEVLLRYQSCSRSQVLGESI
ncbi:hypothetical protein [Bradyrhizobium sp. Cp5.3]|uniref:hypothetical protein n=1 Tax=Bradyrhizobium sp. Cp5.3 TaxID=443598 RepID=UPI00352752A3